MGFGDITVLLIGVNRMGVTKEVTQRMDSQAVRRRLLELAGSPQIGKGDCKG